jgi:hypothetical protein
MRPPAYARDLIALQRSGRNLTWLVISVGWNYGKAFPRLVVPDDVDTRDLDLAMLSGIATMVVHNGAQELRALDVAELALAGGADMACVFDMAQGRMTFSTADVLAIRGRKAA